VVFWISVAFVMADGGAPVPAVMTWAETGLVGPQGRYDGIALTAANVELAKILEEINGQDAYSSTSANVVGAAKEEYLALPDGGAFPTIPAAEVGSATAGVGVKVAHLAQVYALKLARAPAGENAVRYAMSRVEAVRMGWVAGQREIVRLPPVANATEAYLTAVRDNADVVHTARTVAFVIPLAAENVFRTMGHHYISGAASDYEEKYRRVLRACLLESIAGWMRSATLYHHVLHWVSPARVTEVLAAQVASSRIPDAIKIRTSAAPAGTALITTTAAVLRAMQGSGLGEKMASVGGVKTALILEVSGKIHKAPQSYHRAYYAYALPALPAAEAAQMEAAKEEAAKIAPITQAYINIIFRGTQLANARALQKHADIDPQRLRLAERYFKAVLRRDVAAFSELFNPLETA